MKESVYNHKKRHHNLDNQALNAFIYYLTFISVKTTLNKFGSFKEVLIFTAKYKYKC
jgi:hypothetical protein